MALNKITYEDKISLSEDPDILNKNKITDDDMNEIKRVVNEAIDNIPEVVNSLNDSSTNKALSALKGQELNLKFNNYTTTDNLAPVALSNSYNDLNNKPNIVEVNNATLTIQKNGINAGTFSANSNTDTNINIIVPTAVSQLENDSSFITNSVNNLINYTLSSNLSNVATSGNYNDLSNKPSLATVATSGSYNDLSNKPSIPSRITVTRLRSSTSYNTSNATLTNAMNYDLLLLLGKASSSNSGYNTALVPTAMFSSSELKILINDEAAYVAGTFTESGNNVLFRHSGRTNTGYIQYIYGITI